MSERKGSVQGGVAFFLVTFSTAFLMTIGARLTNWFTDVPRVVETRTMGVAIMVAVVIMAIGFALRRMSLMEFRSALLGAASVLLAISLSGAAHASTLNGVFTFIFVLGLVLLAAGLFVSWRMSLQGEEPND